MCLVLIRPTDRRDYDIFTRCWPKEGEDALTVYVSDTGSTTTTYTDSGTSLATRYVHHVKAALPQIK